jgi:hypothetical protein
MPAQNFFRAAFQRAACCLDWEGTTAGVSGMYSSDIIRAVRPYSSLTGERHNDVFTTRCEPITPRLEQRG